jgi:hypothetical protein
MTQLPMPRWAHVPGDGYDADADDETLAQVKLLVPSAFRGYVPARHPALRSQAQAETSSSGLLRMCSRRRPSKPPAGGSKAPARANIPGRPLSNTGCVGAVGTPPSMGEVSPRRDDGSKFEDAAGATPFHHSPMPALIWPALPGAAGDVAGADVPGAPDEGVGRTDGLVGVPSAVGATRALPKASDRNSSGTSDGPIRCGVSGEKCSGGSVGSTAGVAGLAGADEREGAGGTRGLRGPGPPITVERPLEPTR